MVRITIQVLEGLERGQVYLEIPTPVTVGREDENTIRLNDERVSRFHAKIQENGGRVILTDLDSTNGTRVNGHPVQMRVLQIGDQISIGRCLLVYGSREQIIQRTVELYGRDGQQSDPADGTLRTWREAPLENPGAAAAGFDLPGSSHLHVAPPEAPGPPDELFPVGPPDIPEGLQPYQQAEVSDMLAYAHEQIRSVILAAGDDPDDRNTRGGMEAMRVHWIAWQRLLRLEMDLAVWLRKLAEPE